jgi:hypothetical protein
LLILTVGQRRVLLLRKLWLEFRALEKQMTSDCFLFFLCKLWNISTNSSQIKTCLYGLSHTIKTADFQQSLLQTVTHTNNGQRKSQRQLPVTSQLLALNRTKAVAKMLERKIVPHQFHLKTTQIVLNNCLIVTLHLLVNLRQHTLPM